jgi:seryl-tRNA synthetase
MPSEELGLSAHRKYDIETWMSAKEFYGEVDQLVGDAALHELDRSLVDK